MNWLKKERAVWFRGGWYRMDEAHLKVLEMIQSGIISAEEGARLLDALGWEAEYSDQPQDGSPPRINTIVEHAETPPASPPAWVQRVWIYPLVAGVLLFGLGTITTTLLAQLGSGSLWLACTLALIGLGALVAILAWWSHTARWLHVRVRDQDTCLNFSLPVPLRLAAWLVRLARPWVPQLRDTPVDELISSMADLGQDGLMVQADEDNGKVEVYFG